MRCSSFNSLLRAVPVFMVLCAAVPLRAATAENLQDESARIADWRAQRLASPTSETGWLTPIGLFWLKDGENSVGRAPTQALSVDDAALAPDTGAFVSSNAH